jgi:hypothetical protein
MRVVSLTEYRDIRKAYQGMRKKYSNFKMDFKRFCGLAVRYRGFARAKMTGKIQGGPGGKGS